VVVLQRLLPLFLLLYFFFISVTNVFQSTLDDPAAVKEETHLVEEESLVQESETDLSVVENPDASSSVYSQDITFSTPVYAQELQSNDPPGERKP
jgi:hypothetical protein